MSVTISKIERVESEIARLQKAIEHFVLRVDNDKHYQDGLGYPETGAVRRASMDLTRALVDLRR